MSLKSALDADVAQQVERQLPKPSERGDESRPSRLSAADLLPAGSELSNRVPADQMRFRQRIQFLPGRPSGEPFRSSRMRSRGR